MSASTPSLPGPSRSAPTPYDRPPPPPTPSRPPRACDRCRKRKVKCDEDPPCKLCISAGVECTHLAPILKRGPRPRPEKSLENRLRNLEQIISAIPLGGQGTKNEVLSVEEVRGIREAAQWSPGSGGASGVVPPAEGGWYQPGGEQVAWQGLQTGYQPIPQDWTAQTPMEVPNNGEPSLVQSMQQPQTYQSLSNNILQNFQIPLPPPPAPAGPENSQTRHDRIYQDASGQLKFLGASSGIPLLDLLKELNVPSPPFGEPGGGGGGGRRAEEDWISMSTAAGLEGWPMRAAVGVGGAGVAGEEARVQEGERGDGEGKTEGEGWWVRVLELADRELIDALVRAYFTTSHLLWPILHVPSFTALLSLPPSHHPPSFLSLLLSMCSLSSRYIGDLSLGYSTASTIPVGEKMVELAKEILRDGEGRREDLMTVQTMFCLAVWMSGREEEGGGTGLMLAKAVSVSLNTGLHRRVDEWESFSCVEIEVRKRTIWALYSLGIEMSSTLGQPPMLRAVHFDVPEPLAIDDAYLTEEGGVLEAPEGTAGVMAGFVASIRLHMILERALKQINQVHRDSTPQTSFLNMVLSGDFARQHTYDESYLIANFASGLPGDWTFTPAVIVQDDNVHFFRKTRAFTFQHYIRLLVARHRFLTLLGKNGEEGGDLAGCLQQVTQAALGIIGTYATILARGRLGLFGVHAIVQLTQAGAGLIGVVLHLQAQSRPLEQQKYLLRLGLQGLSSGIAVLRHLGKRRPAGTKSANILAEFSKACHLPIVEPLSPVGAPAPSSDETPNPMLRALPRRFSKNGKRPDMPLAETPQMSFDELLEATFTRGHDLDLSDLLGSSNLGNAVW